MLQSPQNVANAAKTSCSLLCHLSICRLAFVVALDIRDSKLMRRWLSETVVFCCHLDTAIAGVVF